MIETTEYASVSQLRDAYHEGTLPEDRAVTLTKVLVNNLNQGLRDRNGDFGFISIKDGPGENPLTCYMGNPKKLEGIVQGDYVKISGIFTLPLDDNEEYTKTKEKIEIKTIEKIDG
ncbi:MAG: hypothetical protein IIC69_01470 [Nanoarchaeota archaeon]|nr:hypothetical protein [Patescibacteria group bacterium]MCH8067229.1 hypothetical protein [Nanoarchaeota archaeon]